MSEHVACIKQIAHCVEVDLLELDTNFLALAANMIDDLIDSSRYDALVRLIVEVKGVRAHGIRLATASLAIREDANIVSVDEGCNQVLHLIIDLALC